MAFITITHNNNSNNNSKERKSISPRYFFLARGEHMSSWEHCVFGASWLQESLREQLGYEAPLPVQGAVIPTLTQSLLSHVSRDVSLTAPTGSGKTLCYLVPMVRFLAEEKKGVDDCKLRCIILVPTKVLGVQVYRELQPLIGHTTITAAHWCSDANTPTAEMQHFTSSTSGGGAPYQRDAPHSASSRPIGDEDSFRTTAIKQGVKDELQQLIRVVRPPPPRALVSFDAFSSFLATPNEANEEKAETREEEKEQKQEGNMNPHHHKNTRKRNSEGVLQTKGSFWTTGTITTARNNNVCTTFPSLFYDQRESYYFKVDVLITTPHRLLQHVDRLESEGLPSLLSSLQLLIMDEADEVLGGQFAYAVAKVVELYEKQKRRQEQRKDEQMKKACRFLTAYPPLPSGVFPGDHARGNSSPAYSFLFPRRAMGEETVLHKILCSATLSSRIARISQVRLRNCIFYSLNSKGKSVRGGDTEGEGDGSTSLVSSSLRSGGNSCPAAPPLFSFPPHLQEHVVFVEEEYRYAVLLKLILSIIQKHRDLYFLQRRYQRRKERRAIHRLLNPHEGLEEQNEETGRESKSGNCKKEKEEQQQYEEQLRNLSANYPPVHPDTGNRVLIFCSSAEEARILAHFLHVGGVPGVLEFTTAATELERRRVLLQQGSGRRVHKPHQTTARSSTSYRHRFAEKFSSVSSNGGAKENDTDGNGDEEDEEEEMPEELEVSCIVASDALMRGIDIPGVGHVVMYRPPETLSQLMHRAGRTARAMRPGHVHLLLTKKGVAEEDEEEEEDDEEEEPKRSSHKEDKRKDKKKKYQQKNEEQKKKKSLKRLVEKELAAGQVAQYLQLSSSVSRTLPLSFERGFFKFRHPPSSSSSATLTTNSTSTRGTTTTTTATGEHTKRKKEEVEKVVVDGTPAHDPEQPTYTEDDGEWWLEEAKRCLERSQHRLQRSWATVMEAAAAAGVQKPASHPSTRQTPPTSFSSTPSAGGSFTAGEDGDHRHHPPPPQHSGGRRHNNNNSSTSTHRNSPRNEGNTEGYRPNSLLDSTSHWNPRKSNNTRNNNNSSGGGRNIDNNNRHLSFSLGKRMRQ